MLVANANTRHTALLIAGSDESFVATVEQFRRYLLSLGVTTLVLCHPTDKEILECIRVLSGTTSFDGTLLVAINAKGTKSGFECSSIFGELSYRRFVKSLPAEPKRVQIIDSSGYAHFLIKEMIGSRSGVCTGIITPWEGFASPKHNLIADVHKAWTKGLLPEEAVTRQIYAGNQDSEFLGVQRWGAIFDDFFVTRRSQQSGLKVAM